MILDQRIFFLQNPKNAYMYALKVDKAPRDDTKEAACKDSYWGSQYKAWNYFKRNLKDKEKEKNDNFKD